MMPAANSFRSIALWLLRGATAMVKTAMFMAMFKATVMAAVVTVAVAATAAAHAASFDCTKARSKLNRMICADAALSALDSQVWDTFGAHLKTLSPPHFHNGLPAAAADGLARRGDGDSLR